METNDPYILAKDDVPDYVLEGLARRLLPKIQAYFESEEGQKAFQEWKERQPK